MSDETRAHLFERCSGGGNGREALTAEELARKVREVLDSASQPATKKGSGRLA